MKKTLFPRKPEKTTNKRILALDEARSPYDELMIITEHVSDSFIADLLDVEVDVIEGLKNYPSTYYYALGRDIAALYPKCDARWWADVDNMWEASHEGKIPFDLYTQDKYYFCGMRIPDFMDASVKGMSPNVYFIRKMHTKGLKEQDLLKKIDEENISFGLHTFLEERDTKITPDIADILSTLIPDVKPETWIQMYKEYKSK